MQHCDLKEENNYDQATLHWLLENSMHRIGILYKLRVSHGNSCFTGNGPTKQPLPKKKLWNNTCIIGKSHAGYQTKCSTQGKRY